MNSFLVAARVVVPMALMMAVGVLMRTTHVTDRPTMKNVDRIVTQVSMPLLMFQNIYTTDFSSFTGTGYFLYGAVGLVLIFLFGILVLPKLMHDPSRAAAMGQALLRPNYILFGNAVAESLYGGGNLGLIMLMGAFTVPFFNALSVVILEYGRNASASPGKLLRSILKNHIVLAALIALVMQALHIRLPGMLEDLMFDLAALATPLSFLSLGVSLDVSAIGKNRRPLVLGVVTRLVLIPVIFVTGAIFLGFRGPELCAIFLLFSAPTAVSSYPMAVAMDADPEIAGQMVIFTTVCCLPTFFLWVLILYNFGLL